MIYLLTFPEKERRIVADIEFSGERFGDIGDV